MMYSRSRSRRASLRRWRWISQCNSRNRPVFRLLGRMSVGSLGNYCPAHFSGVLSDVVAEGHLTPSLNDNTLPYGDMFRATLEISSAQRS